MWRVDFQMVSCIPAFQEAICRLISTKGETLVLWKHDLFVWASQLAQQCINQWCECGTSVWLMEDSESVIWFGESKKDIIEGHRVHFWSNMSHTCTSTQTPDKQRKPHEIFLKDYKFSEPYLKTTIPQYQHCLYNKNIYFYIYKNIFCHCLLKLNKSLIKSCISHVPTPVYTSTQHNPSPATCSNSIFLFVNYSFKNEIIFSRH